MSDFTMHCATCRATEGLSMIAHRVKGLIIGWLFVCENHRSTIAGSTVTILQEGFMTYLGDIADLEAKCPDCGAELALDVDLSEGPPDEVGTECDCGAIPVWKLTWWYDYKLGEFAHFERRKVAGAINTYPPHFVMIKDI